jgi:hypothetical protein
MTGTAKAFLAGALAAGCVASGPSGSVDVGASGYPPLARDIPQALVADVGEFAVPQEVLLPATDRWPRTFPDAGPFYVLAQFSPLVFPVGVLRGTDRLDGVGYGLGALAGWRLPLTNAFSLGFEVQGELSEHKNPSAGVKAHHTRLGGAVRATFNLDRNLRPFGVAGGGEYEVQFNEIPGSFHLAGPGVFLGGGVDYVHLDRLAIRGEMTLHLWNAAEKGSGASGQAAMLFIGAGAAFSF